MEIIGFLVLSVYGLFLIALVGGVFYYGAKRIKEYRTDKYKNIKY